MKRKILFKIPLIAGIIFLVVFIIMLLWNAIVPDLFHGPVISYWQAAGLLLLSKLLFGGFRGRPHRNGWHRERWRRRFEEKLSAMTPEEKEKYFKERWNRYCYPREESNKPENSGAEASGSKSK
jgi:hypothetical protein